MKNLLLSLFACTLISISCNTIPDTKMCIEHVKNCPVSENCPEHPECEAHENCEKGKVCSHEACMAHEKEKASS